MNKYSRFIPPILPLSHVTAVSAPVLLTVESPGNTEYGQQAGWKNEAGCLATLSVTMSVLPEIRSDSLEIPLTGTLTGTSNKVLNVPSAASGKCHDYASDRSRAYVCPKCGGPVKRLQRRFIDRLVSLINPVRRYRCRARGCGCDWKGNLPVYCDIPRRFEA